MLAALAGVLAALGLSTVGEQAAGASTVRHVLYAYHADHLWTGERLYSPSGYYHATMQANGYLSIHSARGDLIWHTPYLGVNPHLTMGRDGQVVLVSGSHVRWATNTHYSGSFDVLSMRDDGTLALTSSGWLVWSSRFGNGCPVTSGKAFVVDIKQQYGRACYRGQQIRETPVTTGATYLGDGTPRGSWRIYARVRDTTLYPSSGGAYPVHYWMPYDGAYGIHDSPWQTFPYGSIDYKTRGSHGCTHVPGTWMAWLFDWAPVGTQVMIF